MAWADPTRALVWRKAYMARYRRTDDYRAKQNAYRAELRRRGLCIECTEVSPRFARCLRCRQRTQARRRARMIHTA